MKNRLLAQLPDHSAFTHTIDEPHLYIVDWKDYKNGKVEISGIEKPDIKAVHLINENRIEIFFDGFPENALPITKKVRSKQCECVIFPNNSNQEEWVLFIETKYAQNLSIAQNNRINYPYQMVQQIKATVAYFRMKGIIATDKIVHAIISFPNLIDNFNSWTFPIIHEGHEETVLDILQNDKIIIRATNKALIQNEKIIILLS